MRQFFFHSRIFMIYEFFSSSGGLFLSGSAAQYTSGFLFIYIIYFFNIDFFFIFLPLFPSWLSINVCSHAMLKRVKMQSSFGVMGSSSSSKLCKETDLISTEYRHFVFWSSVIELVASVLPTLRHPIKQRNRLGVCFCAQFRGSAALLIIK